MISKEESTGWDVLGLVMPLIRASLVSLLIWYSCKTVTHARYFSGLQSAAMAIVVSYAYLETLFAPVKLPFDAVALNILVITSGFVGMCLGVLLPRLFPGVTLGYSTSLLLGMFIPLSSFYFPISGTLLAVAFSYTSIKCNRLLISTVATTVITGGLATGVVFPHIFRNITMVVRGVASETYSKGLVNSPTFDTSVGLGLAWICLIIVCACVIYIRQGGLRSATFIRLLQNGDANEAAYSVKRTAPLTPPVYHSPPPTSPDVFNMFDPADLPPRLSEYANTVYSACEDLGNFFGFQDSSVRNQAEHLLILLSNNRRYMSNHILRSAMQPPSPIHALHAKVFSNYMKWCRAMGVPPNFSKMNSSMSAPPPLASRVVDLVLFFCIWGESVNVRHMPECMWFLYHKMMEQYTMSEGFTQARSLYAGHFVDKVIFPIYEIVSASMKSKSDHHEKKNYDDFNEFFWSRSCLRFAYCQESASDIEGGPRLVRPLPGESLQPITVGLANSPKTFLEKRSWLRGVLAMYRILEWHIISFFILAIVAFSRELVWGWVYALQVGSGVFWIINFLQLVSGILEVWALYPGIQLNGTIVCGAVFSILARFLILVYQTLYLMWTFGPTNQTHLGIKEDTNFWWWQYIWLSVLCMIPWFVEAIAQFYPPITSKIYTAQNDYLQSFLNILFPLSRLYVGKEVHESFKNTVVYSFFWLTLIAWKLYFSYVFEVYSMVLPTIELVDDYVNYSNQSFAQMSLLLSMRWFPQFLVYLIDMSIWYAVWQGFSGTSVGFSEHLGDIRTISDIRSNFGRAPEHFCHKMLSPDAGSRRGSSASFLAKSSSNSFGDDERKSLLGSDPHKLQGYVNRLLDVRVQKWVMFSAAWNDIIDHFREEDIISNAERDNLKFSRFDGFSQAIYLPVFQTAGVIEDIVAELELGKDETVSGGSITDEDVFKPILTNIINRTTVSEVWELGSFVLLQLVGSKHKDDLLAITGQVLKWSETGNLSKHIKVDKMRTVLTNLVKLVTTLQKGIRKRKPAPKPRQGAETKFQQASNTASRGMRRAVSAASLSSFEVDSKQKVREISSKPTPDALRDQVRDHFRAMAYALKGVLNGDLDSQTSDISDRLTFMLSMENGFLWNDEYASDQLDVLCKDPIFKDVLTKVFGLIACDPNDVEPKSKEARRRLTFFVNSLFMDMPDAPSIHDMFSWNVLTPYYSEPVTYSKSELEQRSDALGVSTLLYLQTLYRSDWNNFLERQGLTDDDKIWSKKHVDETRTWASLRAQTLQRTVHGMMYYEKALRLLANLERIDDDTANYLLGEKFGYIVSCQVYGNQKKNQSPAADDIENLMHRFPLMRVAYIDSIRVSRTGASVYYSVLVKSDGHGGIQEVYRVRLPGNPVLGEGKPENQNHAMIFTRGEFLQTIDMNQEGYFEEALKMRNALQEFAKRDGPLPTTILGLREHIFTGSISSLANYMALQETSFVTLGQRVLETPLRMRLHYGHPDVFDKLFFITRGGISKSSKGINLSEDIFVGYNNVLRGGQVGFKEYLQVGKGRDVGMSQIYKFEAKLSQGNGEQSLSRDVYRMCQRLDFCRLLSYYFGGIGHYFSNVLTILTIYVVVYLMAMLAVYDLESIGGRKITPMGFIQMLLGGLGLLQTIPLFATLGVERGWWNSAREIIHVFITGGPLHFMFHIQTKAHYMSQTILVGGAKYRATGRGFVTQHTPMDEQFRFFASSHLYLGVELSAGLIIMAIFSDAGQYIGRTWSLWLASVSFLASPFWFNPLSFDWNVVTSDYRNFLAWMSRISGGSNKSWSIWWREENAFYKNLSFASKCVYLIKSCIYLLLAEGIRTSSFFKSDPMFDSVPVGVSTLFIIVIILVVFGMIYSSSKRSMPYPVRRTIGILITVGLITAVLTIYLEDSDTIRYSMSAYYAIGAICQIGLLFGVGAVKQFYFIHDMLCGHIIFVPLFILAALQIPSYIQTWLLYHNALSSDVVVSDILKYARKNKEAAVSGEENEALSEQVTELRKIVQQQEEIMAASGLLTKDIGSGARNFAVSKETDAIASLVTPSEDIIKITQPAPSTATSGDRSLGGRSVSMSGLDVWGSMAIGNTGTSENRDSSLMQENASQQRMSASNQTNQGFSFSQPDTMPPR